MISDHNGLIVFASPHIHLRKPKTDLILNKDNKYKSILTNGRRLTFGLHYHAVAHGYCSSYRYAGYASSNHEHNRLEIAIFRRT